MELRNRKRLRCDYSTYIPTATRGDDDGEYDYDKNVYLAFGMYVFFFGIVAIAVMGCNQKYTTYSIHTKPIVSVLSIPLMPSRIIPNTIQPFEYTIKNHTQLQRKTQKQQPEIKTRIYSVFIQTSNYSSAIEFYRNRHSILKEFIHNTNNKKHLDWIHMTLKKYNSNFNSCFMRMNEYSQSNFISPNTYNLIASNTVLSTNRPTEFIDITIISGNTKIVASQSVITIYDTCM